ncbi:MAG: type II secretion system protein GspG [Phycisphaeraceae bacterium]|nr:MAG: type II secretion system protein GspG [Phycisphaeraceae bacterium]
MTTRITKSTPRRARRAARAFSLLELMLVLVILGLLSTVAAVALLPQAQKAKVQTTKASLNVINGAIKQFQVEKSRLPNTLADLIPDFIEAGKTKDGWRNEIYYKPTPGAARDYELLSFGKDGTPGTDDDIDVWTMDFEEEN